MQLKVNYLCVKRRDTEKKTLIDCGNVMTGVRSVQDDGVALKLGEGSISSVIVQASYDNTDGVNNFLVFICDKAHKTGLQLMPGQITPPIATDNLNNIWIFGVPGGSEVAFIGARATATVAQSVTDNTFEPLQFPTVDYDTSSIIVGNTLVASQTAFWEVFGSVAFDINGSGVRGMRLFVNGGSGKDLDVRNAVVANTATVSVQSTVFLNAGDIVTFDVFQDSGGGLTILTAQVGMNVRGV